jgi:hypothetical protein
MVISIDMYMNLYNLLIYRAFYQPTAVFMLNCMYIKYNNYKEEK